MKRNNAIEKLDWSGASTAIAESDNSNNYISVAIQKFLPVGKIKVCLTDSGNQPFSMTKSRHNKQCSKRGFLSVELFWINDTFMKGSTKFKAL